MASTDPVWNYLRPQAPADRPSRDAAKWSARKTLLFIVGASLALWLAILLVATQWLG